MSAPMTVLELLEAARRCGVPSHVRDGLAHYVFEGRPTGSFLEAVISNDLMDALGRADIDCRFRIFEIGSFLYNYAPRACYGSRDAYADWIITHRKKREQEKPQ